MCVMAELAMAGRAVRMGYWTAVILGVLAILAILFTPIVGLLYALFFLAVAWGIRRGQPWAALTGGCFLAFSVAVVVSRGRDTGSTPLVTLMLGLAVNLVAAYLLFSAAKPLWREEKPANRTFAALRVWPWLLVLAMTGMRLHGTKVPSTGCSHDSLPLNIVLRKVPLGEPPLFSRQVDQVSPGRRMMASYGILPTRLARANRIEKVAEVGKALDGLACYAEVGGRREHVAIIGPHSAFSDFVCRRKVYCVGGAYEEIAGAGNHQRTGPPQQSLVDGNEVPQSVLYVLGEAQGQFARITE